MVQIVVTPGSGAGLALVTARRLSRRLRRSGREASIRSFDNLAGLTQWAETCEPEFSHLVCIGGDATLSAAARAAIRHGVPFVPVPSGPDGVFASVFGHPHRSPGRGGADRVGGGAPGGRRSRARGERPRRIFLSHRSFGVLEQIQQAAERGRKQPRNRLLRYLWYWGVAYQFFFRTRLAAFTVEVDDTPVIDDAVLVTVASVETYRAFCPSRRRWCPSTASSTSP